MRQMGRSDLQTVFLLVTRVTLSRAILFATVILVPLAAYSQIDNPVLGYVRPFASINDGNVYDVIIDTDGPGNVVGTGRFEGTVDFDPGPDELLLIAEGYSDAFVFKLDTTGHLLWAKRFGGPGEVLGSEIDVDPFGNVYCTGTFSLTADFDPGPGERSLTSLGERDQFALKLDTAGDLEWAWAIESNGVARAYGIRADSAGDVLVAGFFEGNTDLDPGPGVLPIVPSRTGQFLSKFDQDGALIWADNLAQEIASFDIDDAGQIAICGVFGRTVDFDPGPGVVNIGSSSGGMHVCMFDENGAFQWARLLLGNRPPQTARDIKFGNSGAIYLTGSFEGSTDFDPGPGTYVLTNTGPRRTPDSFICKLSASGDFAWARKIGSPDEYDRGLGIALDSEENVYARGYFRAPENLTPGLGLFPPTASWRGDSYIFKLSSSGAYTWAGAISSRVDTGSIAVDDAGRIYKSGAIDRTADVDPGPGTYRLESSTRFDGFLIRLEAQSPPSANDDYGDAVADEVLTVLTSPAGNSVLDNDTDGNEAATLVVSSYDTTSVLGALVTIYADGTFLYDPTGVPALQILSIEDTVFDRFDYEMTDGLDTSNATVLITVKGGIPVVPVDRWMIPCICILIVLEGARRLRMVPQP